LDALHKGGYGALGVALWIIAVYGLPLAYAAIQGQVDWKATPQTVLGLIGFIVFYLVLGAAAPFVADAGNAKEAISLGLGWQGVFGQFVKPK
jgi:hypothetical protein